MATYLELKEQAEKLLQQAEAMRQKETDQVIEDVKAKMKAYGLTASDLGFGGGAKGPRAKKAAKSASPVKYRGPNGETWGGGRGRKPGWVVAALAKGKKIEDFAV